LHKQLNLLKNIRTFLYFILVALYLWNQSMSPEHTIGWFVPRGTARAKE